MIAPQFPPHAPQYGALDTYRVAAQWLDGHGDVYDWGCGQRFAERFFSRSRYIGIDGCFDGSANCDLALLDTGCDSILMRHVLEHNVAGAWRVILENAVRSFRQRMALVTFTPFARETHVLKTEHYATGSLPYLSFCKDDLVAVMGPHLVADYPVPTTHPEHVFLLEKSCA